MTHYPARSKIYHIKSDSMDSSKINKDESHAITVKPIIINKMPENSNPLSGLLGQYDSDSDHETMNGQESHKLDAKVDNFLQEINQIAPEHKSIQKQTNTQTCAWQECFDESTGYPYYWNVDNNTVTWEMPPEYKNWLTQTKIVVDKPLAVAPIINQIQLNTEKQLPIIVNAQNSQTRQKKKKVVKKPFKDAGSSDDEKIVMITSFSEASSSESENEIPQNENEEEVKKSLPENKVVMGPYVEDIPKEPTTITETKKEIIENVKDENIDETVILARLRTQAKVLHELGGELPKSVDKTILAADKLENNKPQSLCLVAGYGYGDDSDHSDVDEESLFKKTIFPINEIKETSNESKTKESTLFPATVAIDVKQFETTPNNTKQIVETKEVSEELIDNKAFKRKKRLGLTFDVKPEKRSKVEENEELPLGETRKGFGFQSAASDCENTKTNSISFKKGGIAFIKADILNSNDSNSESRTSDNKEPEDFMEIKNIVTEKVNFLGEGKDPVSAVQIMSIQLQTLEAAYNVEALTKSYLYSWLRETFTGLEKLEEEAAPEGWTCQWDRSNKRYFYRNTASGETQWHFPDLDVNTVEPDIVGGGEAMDICTTPPPNDDDIQPQPELPIRKGNETPSPPPPPPPSRVQNSPSPQPQPPSPPPLTNKPPPPPDDVIPPPPPTISQNQPLPPGVDSSDLPFFTTKLKENSKKSNETGNDSLGSELDSFYSDIAQLEASSQGSVPDQFETKSVSSPSSIGENTAAEAVTKKKKKIKQKIGQGINMKKKAVSSLVEKWKKVQNDY